MRRGQYNMQDDIATPPLELITSGPDASLEGLIHPESEPSVARLLFDSNHYEKLTHYLFRYPAKFHPPAVRKLIELFSSPRETILDPFCGSGTLLIEASVTGRHAVGTDIDPVAVFVSTVKIHRYDPDALARSWKRLRSTLSGMRRSQDDYEKLTFTDVEQAELDRVKRKVFVPDIPRIEHWFRRYVIVDLAKILDAVKNLAAPETHRRYFRLAFASIIRSVSNADPVPVSGLEVTKHMRRLAEEGRTIDPFDHFFRAVEQGLLAVQSYANLAHRECRVRAFSADATRISRILRHKVDLVITSPPYHGAVDYYRRHTLEMYWLEFTKDHEERLRLLQKYIGRPTVPASHPLLQHADPLPSMVRSWHERIRSESKERADAFLHYVVGIRKSIREMSEVLGPGSLAIFIVGRSTWNGYQIPTSTLLTELAEPFFDLAEQLWYPLRNRYMSYSRHNGADINQEQVIVLRKRPVSLEPCNVT